MKKIFMAILLLIFSFSNILAKTFYLTPQNEKTKIYSSSITKKSSTSNKLKLGEVYQASKIENNRLFINDLSIWVEKKDINYDVIKSIIQYKAQYLTTYQKDKEKELQRRKDIVKANPNWKASDKKAIVDGVINPNWSVELVLASWGEPSKRLNFKNKNGIEETRLLYGQKLLIFENDSLKYHKMHYTENLNVHLDKKKSIVDSTASNRNDSTLAD